MTALEESRLIAEVPRGSTGTVHTRPRYFQILTRVCPPGGVNFDKSGTTTGNAGTTGCNGRSGPAALPAGAERLGKRGELLLLCRLDRDFPHFALVLVAPLGNN